MNRIGRFFLRHTGSSFVLILSCMLAACEVNPVTGKQELGLISASQEIAIGSQQYQPSQQSQGGQYNIEPALGDYLSEVGNKLARVSDRPELPYEFVLLNNDTPNAWALPGGKIAVNRGLLVHLRDEAELAAVLAHEIVHAAARHGAQQMEQGMLLGAGLQVLGAAAGDAAYRDVILQGAGLGAQLIQTRYGRGAELEADYYGMRYMSAAGYDPSAAVDLQRTFVELSKDRKESWLTGLFSTHPPSMERVEANRRTAAALPAGGIRGAKPYAARIAGLRHDQPAYEHYREAVNSLNSQNYETALEQIDRSISIQPSQGLFHELRGIALKKLGRPKPALAALNQAVRCDGSFFRYRLLRGLHARDMGNHAAAEQDLLAANKLLPTAQASFALGELRQAAGDPSGAADYYRAVAQSDSPLAPAAREKLQQLSLERS